MHLNISNELWQAVLRTSLSSLLSVLALFAIIALWVRLRHHPIAKRVRRSRRAICTFLALTTVAPLLLFLLNSSWGWVYLRELLLSGVFLVSASITVKVVARIEQSKAEAAEQLISWEKWMQGNLTGWHELWEEVCFAGELHPTVRTAVREELQRVQGENSHLPPRPGQNGQYEKRLRLLLMSPEKVGKLSADENVPEKEVDSPGYIHSDVFSSYIARNVNSVV